MSKRRKENVWWGNRDVSPVPYYALCLSKRNFKREVKRLGATARVKRWITRGADATTHHFGQTKGGSGVKNCCVICLDLKAARKREPVEVQGVLIHEGVHVWQEQLRVMNEDRPSPEFEAYAVQSIAQNLIHAYNELTKPRKRKKKVST